MNQNKTKVQRQLLKSWADHGFKGYIEAVTGIGKTRIGVIAAGEFIRRDPNETSLVVTPTIPLRDDEWHKEFVKWGYEDVVDKVEFQCIQGVYKQTGRHWDTLVVDEADTCLGDKYSEFFKNNTFNRILCLSACYDKKDVANLQSLGIPLVGKIDYEEALKYNLITPFKIYNVRLQLNPEQNLAYYELDKKINLLVSDLCILLNAKASTVFTEIDKFKTAYERNCIARTEQAVSVYNKVAALFTLYNNRKSFLSHGNHRISDTLLICLRIPEKVLVFCGSIAMASKLASRLSKVRKTFLYHSKMPEEVRRRSLEQFKESSDGILVSINALNRGINVPDCNFGVICSASSSEHDFIQRLGREVRLSTDPNKVAILIQPFYAGTQEEKWLRKRIGSLETTDITKDDLFKLLAAYKTS
jgi:RNA polymerase primary sigma factor